MLQAFFLSLGQLLDPRIMMVFLKSLIVTLLLFACGGVGLWFAMDWLGAVAGSWLGMNGGSGAFASIATLVLLLIAWWLLFRAIAVAVIGIFADEVVAAVEAKHYPGAHAGARDLPFARSLAMGLGSAGRIVAVNLLLSPVYLMLLITGVGTAILFFLVNSWLLGRDLGDMVAARHMPYDALPAWRKQTGGHRFLLGAIGTALFLVPILNLLAPIVGAAMATHLFHRRLA
ncbi:EI24 domain-containing protein [Sphingomonas sp. M1-B02]|uniref:EI24 domain-containing protein n=1 Tax=Sphingomonas sp. M1-B02 TaxID=3114300 RepID=UPI0022406EE2|nr:EI24 domain-containing protein [Sphingomonas sp. S6-11]UZK67643.1 EI24 domain-containing protein [Sphingomonas sp. S6-11]